MPTRKSTSKPYLIVNIVEGTLVDVHERQKYKDALNVAVEMALEQDNVNREDVRDEFKQDGDWVDSSGNIRIYITQADDK